VCTKLQKYAQRKIVGAIFFYGRGGGGGICRQAKDTEEAITYCESMGFCMVIHCVSLDIEAWL